MTAVAELRQGPATAGPSPRLGAKRAVLYCRISKDRLGLDLANERQEAICREVARARGFEVVAVYADTDTSAYKRNVKRPAYDRTLESIARDEADVIVVYALDRFVRRTYQLESVIDSIESALAVRGGGRKRREDGFEVVSATGGAYDLSTPGGRFSARSLANAALFEMEQKAMRQADQNDQLAGRGWWRGGPAPFGYRNGRAALPGGHAHATAGTLEVEPAEALEVEWMVERIVDEGWSLNRVVLDLNRRGVKTVRGVAWSRQTVRRLMMTGAIAGRITRKDGTDLGEGNWVAIVPYDRWLRLQSVLADPKRRNRRPGPTREYLLTGLVYVGAGYDDEGWPVPTDRRLNAHARENGRRCYATVGDAFHRGEQSITVDAAGLERLVVEVVLAKSDEGILLDLSGDKTSNALIAQRLAALEDDEAELMAGKRAGDFTMRQYREASADLVAQRAELERSLTVRAAVDRDLERFLTTKGALRKAWEADRLTFEQKRRLLRRIPVRVDVGPVREVRRTFDPARVRVTLP